MSFLQRVAQAAQPDATAQHYKGAWDNATAYVPNDVVSRTYGLYAALTASTNVDPAAPVGAPVATSIIQSTARVANSPTFAAATTAGNSVLLVVMGYGGTFVTPNNYSVLYDSGADANIGGRIIYYLSNSQASVTSIPTAFTNADVYAFELQGVVSLAASARTLSTATSSSSVTASAASGSALALVAAQDGNSGTINTPAGWTQRAYFAAAGKEAIFSLDNASSPVAVTVTDSSTYVLLAEVLLQRPTTAAWKKIANLGADPANVAPAANLDTLALHHRGAWSSSTAYNVNDSVFYNGALFRANVATGPNPLAPPTYIASSTPQAVVGAGSIGVALPAAAATGDVALLFVSVNGSGLYPATPTGWAVVGSGSVAGTNTESAIVYSKTLVVGDLGSTVTITNPAGGDMAGFVRIYRNSGGVDAFATSTATALSVTAPSVVTTAPTDTVVAFYGVEAGANLGSPVPANSFAAGAVNPVLFAQVSRYQAVAAQDITVSATGSSPAGPQYNSPNAGGTQAIVVVAVAIKGGPSSGFPTVSWDALSPAQAVTSQTANYTMKPEDDIVLASGTITITLPAAASSTAHRYTVKNTGTGTITVAPAAGTIDGAANFTLTVQNSALDVVSDGTNWFTV